MNLLDTASLVVTPNGYKASKLYSIVPTDGTGDMTFARTGDTATRVNSSGLIESVLANKPRLDYLGGGCPKLLLEPQRTNLHQYSNNLTNAYWGKFNLTAASNSSVAPDGGTSCSEINYTGSGGLVYKDTVATAAGTYAFSMFAKYSNQAVMKVGITDNSVSYETQVNIQTGVITVSPAGITSKIEAYGNGWYRITLIRVSAGSAGGIGPFFGFFGTNSGKILIYGMQFEAGAYATSYIPTTTASVTRNADSCSKTSISSLIGQTEGTIYGEFSNTAKLAGGRYFSLSDGSAGDRIDVYANSTSQIGVYAAKSYTAILNSTVNLTANSSFKYAIGYKAGSWVFYLNGVQIATSTNSNVPTLTAIQLSTDSLGGSAGEGVLFKSGALWKTRLTNQELVTLTSL